MAQKGQEIGRTYLEGVLSKITDPELKTQAQRVFADATVQVEIGGGVAGQQEIDRQLQDLRAQQETLTTQREELDDRETKLTEWHTNLTGWADQHKEFVRLGKAAKERGWDGKAEPPKGKAGDPPAGITEDKLRETLQVELGGVLNFALDQNALGQRHFDTFGKMLDIRPLVTHPKIRELGLVGVYELVHKDALEAKARDRETAREAEIRADERKKVHAEHVAMPYPSPTGAGSGSPLDAIKPAGNQPVVDAAVTEYQRLQQQRTSA